MTVFFGLIVLLAGLSLTAPHVHVRPQLARLTSVPLRPITGGQSTPTNWPSGCDQPDEFGTTHGRTSRSKAGGTPSLDRGPRLATPSRVQRYGPSPPSFVTAVALGPGRPTQRFIGDNGEPYLACRCVHRRCTTPGTSEAFPLRSTERTSTVVLTTLIIGRRSPQPSSPRSSGWSTSCRLLRPFSRVADAAGEIVVGEGSALGFEPASDPDLARLARTRSTTWPTPSRRGSSVRFASAVRRQP